MSTRTRWILAIAVLAVAAVILMFAIHAWLIVTLALLAAVWLRRQIRQSRMDAGRGDTVITCQVEYRHDDTEVADAIRDASIRNWVIDDMEGRR